MIKALSPNKVGLVLGALLVVFHLCWSILVALGWAQFVIDWIFTLHMIQPVYQIMPFSFGLMLGLLVMVFVIGYAMGYVGGLLWNFLHDK
ncbi:MAG: hypothetical protein WCW31_02490 [Patescibacteria group bacterium]|jgi:hypothetical protein